VGEHLSGVVIVKRSRRAMRRKRGSSFMHVPPPTGSWPSACDSRVRESFHIHDMSGIRM
jgi:hypothetical protein